MQNLREAYEKSLSRELLIEDRKKVANLIKYYLARACLTCRYEEVIQRNHYVDNVYQFKGKKNSRVILSPSCVPFPVAADVNVSLTYSYDTKVFMVDQNEIIVPHPTELIIPILLAFYSGGENSRSLGELIHGVLFCAEIACSLMIRSEYMGRKAALMSVVLLIWLQLEKEEEDGTAAAIVELACLRVDMGSLEVRACLDDCLLAATQPRAFMGSARQQHSRMTRLWDGVFVAPDRWRWLDNVYFSSLGLSPLATLVEMVILQLLEQPTEPDTVSELAVQEIQVQVSGTLHDSVVCGDSKDNSSQMEQALYQAILEKQLLPTNCRVSVELGSALSGPVCDRSRQIGVRLLVDASQAKKFPQQLFSISDALALLSIDSATAGSLDTDIDRALTTVIGCEGSAMVVAALNSEQAAATPLLGALSLLFERPGLD